MFRRIWTLGVLASPFLAATAQAPADYSTSGAEAGLTRVTCQSEDGSQTYRSRGGIVDTRRENDPFEVIVTTSHGLPGSTGAVLELCSIEGDEGALYPIREMHRPPPRGRGPIDDWTVLVMEGRFGENAQRVRIADRPLDVASGSSVRLPLFFAPTERACSVIDTELPDVRRTAELFAHDCRAWPGLSGSPIVTMLDERPALIGIHLGSFWMIDVQTGVEVGRYIDATVLTTIEALVANARAAFGSD